MINRTRLTFNERLRIEDMVRRNICNSHIALEMDRAASTIHYEVGKIGRDNYTAYKAQALAHKINAREIATKNSVNSGLNSLIGRATLSSPNGMEELVSVLQHHAETLEASLGKIYDCLKKFGKPNNPLHN